MTSAINRTRTEARECQTASSGVFFKIKRILHRANSAFQTIEIIENEDYGRVLLLDGLVQTTERDEFYYHEMLVHPALACHPRPEDVLIIGGGDGGALREVLKHAVKKAWLVEIDGEVIEACRRHFPWLGPALRDKRANLVVDDGDAFLGETDLRFDVILVDSSDPVGPSTVLHQESFYRKLKRRLKPGGVIGAQAGSLLLHMDSHRRKAIFLGKIFKVSRFYLGPVPTYPVGTWVYNFLSDSIDPLACRKLRIPKALKYFSPEIHKAAFSLPPFFKK